MTSYTVDFARLRARQRNRRDVLEERHSQERAALEAEVVAELAKLDDLERAVVEMVDEKEANPKKPAPAASRGGRKYTADQDAEIIATPVKKDLRRLAEKWGRSFEGVEKHRENLLKQQRAAGEQPRPTPEPDSEAEQRRAHVAALGAGDSRERPEPTPQPPATPRFDNQKAMEWKGSARNRPPPGTPVRGLTDDGPEHPRVLDPSAFSSPGRDGR